MTETNHSQTIPISPNVFPMTTFNLPKNSNWTCADTLPVDAVDKFKFVCPKDFEELI